MPKSGKKGTQEWCIATNLIVKSKFGSACVSFSPLAPYSAPSIILPLVVVIGATMAKEGVEDWRRNLQDIEANNRKVEVYDKSSCSFRQTKWKDLRVGDLVKVCKDEYFPADLLLLSSSYEDVVCYVETMNLDGETNLKLKHALNVTSFYSSAESLKEFRAVIKCEDPNEHLYSFIGTLYFDCQQYSLSPQQILLRDSKLKNTEYIFGVVIFTGHDTKVMQNATDPPSKRTKIERRMDRIIYVLFSTLILVSFIGSLFFGIETNNDLSGGNYTRWYLRPDKTTVFFDPRRPAVAAFLHCLTGLMLYGYLIPISLYVSIEICKVLQSIFINQDQAMYDEEMDRPAHARTSNLNEELGQVHTILSDKTGTLTCNSMEFVKCSIAGTLYGRGMTEVEIALARKRGEQLTEQAPIDASESKKSIKGFNFRDERIMDGKWVSEPQSDVIQKFFRVLATCHTAVPEVMGPDEIMYEAESPDEAAFVIAAREVGFEFFARNQTSIKLRELDPTSGIRVDRVYELLHVLEFSSARKRMSVIVKNPENQLLLLAKGADSVIFERLSKEGRAYEERTKEHIEKYSEAGLRTMAVAYRELDNDEYKTWEQEFLKAKTSVSADRDVLMDELACQIERDLILLGATAVEDKLQKGVPGCIDKLARAGIGIWVLTGDKRGTAINIGYACSLLRHGMKQIVITLELPEILAQEKEGDKEAIAEASLNSIKLQILKAKSQVTEESSTEFGLIIDGKSLTYAMDKNLVNSFMDLAMRCATVICCRSSPKQKAVITRLVKSVTGRTTLAIGDGANDVGMLQEADIGVGISGVEGMQAVMASDFAIAQFRFLERLLLVHGHWCYRRISMMICYFFYKNITFGFTLFWFEAYTSFSGQPAYNDWYMSCYNVFFTSLPVIALGVFDQDVSARLCLKHPLLYQEGVRNILFNWPRILGWMFNGLLSSIIIYFLTTNSITGPAFRKDGQVADYSVLGVTMYTCVVWTVNCQMALSINYFTWIQHLFIWGSIAFWYIFLVVYGSIPPTLSTTAYKVLVEACAPSILYWLTTLLVVIAALLPLLSYRAFQIRFRPMEHDRIQIQRRRPESTEYDATQRRLSESSEARTSSELPSEVRIRIDNLKASSKRKN
ncbi:probable phospholipid-transporting ATPase 8 isoform X2 [Gossypium arboreum]|uniref:probable phospholipid-transporting ATPase 8 isoform X2 n=2 Tax=Gossypium arboreum TaxID=29729 RepID=UPI0022F16485|nr:probable phospholipid-transporting ATPase 8 isoform X2 [Gossypium arboreum]XP_052882961.1 probable phospholipid-transporting ATPase 8 isoform X2 [Gossypium arboreum]